MSRLTAHELGRFAPSHDTHWAVILNRGYVRTAIIEIRRARQGRIDQAGAEVVFLKRLAWDWKLYRWAMGAQESERRTWRKMTEAVIAPMLRAAE